MNQKEEKGSSGPKPRYVWDPKKLAWVETTEAETEEAAPEKAAVESTREAVVEEVTAGAKEEEGSAEVPVEAAPVEVPVEAVGPQYRGAWIRLVAFIIDGVLLLIILLILSSAFGTGAIINTAEGKEVMTFVRWQQWAVASLILVYFVGFWAWRGQTPGKMLIGAKIVKKDGRPIGIIRALLRFAVYFAYLIVWAFAGLSILVMIIILFVVMLTIAVNRGKRGIHDFIAGTVVIKSRTKKAQPVEAEPADTSEIAEPSVASEPDTDKQD